MLSNRNKYKVLLQGRAGLIYEESGRSILIDSEMLAGPDYDIVIYTNSIKPRDNLVDNGCKNEDEVARIRGNIAKELSKFRIDWQ